MTLAELRDAVHLLRDAPGDMPVAYLTKTGAIKPVDSVRWSPLVDGIAVFEKDKNK